MKLYLKDGYIFRDVVPDFDDTTFADEWQDEVYHWAREIYLKYQLQSIIDVGTGSAYKLNKYFNLNNSIGIDSPNTVAFLKKAYPSGVWCAYDDLQYDKLSSELVLAIDVIEHVADPHDFLQKLSSIRQARYILLSTPERDVKWGIDHIGPPPNPFHHCEWNTIEFVQLISEYFTPIEHRIMNFQQGTQSLLCLPKK